MALSSKFSIGTKLGVGQGALIVAVLTLFGLLITSTVTSRLAAEAEGHLALQAESLVNSMSSYHGALSDGAVKLAALFRSTFPGPFAVDATRSVTVAGRSTPQLTSGATVLNLNTAIVDRFTALTNAAATVFVRSGDDFVRIATSLSKEDGSRAVGTALDRDHPAYRRLLEGQEFVGKATLFDRDYMTRYLPIKDGQGRVIGILFIGLDFTQGLKALKEKVRAAKVGKTGYIFAVDARPGKEQGRLVIHPTREGENIIDSTDADGRKFVREMIATQSGVIRYGWLNKEAGETAPRAKVVAYRHFREWNWVIGVGSYQDEFAQVAHMVRNTVFLAMAVVCLLLFSVSYLLVRKWVTAPVRELLEQTGRYASGDFSQVAEHQERAGQPADEVELIAQGVDAMALSLRRILVKVTDSAQEVSVAAAQVSVAAERIAAGADEVVGKTAAVATAGEEMAATSNDIARNCQLAVEEAQRATQSAQNGTEVVGKTVAVMARIAEKVQESTATVESLGASGEQIGEIIGTIEDIADQTNLLALNAAIEAARAGELGRGFAVVADEVRALAERTTKATHQIGIMIKTIQSETQQAVSVMEQGVSGVKAGTEEASRSGAALVGIKERVDAFGEQISQIAAAAEEQTATTSEISGSILQVTDVVQSTAAAARESAVAAAQLHGTAQELQRLVGQFRLAS
ncbi:methyl-accepting chemotaxis protein [Geomonas paludis]|uniref:Methyl-accepting chemotaxis protein n=1 Tax=Geomonas paludis TaxID=2740185 RepID=A0A6V8N0T2_9BACT|nr:methyl-accepting chemotaxis protein [Geomonas paludis]UPU37163.1 methyl-accepting chemotaxis protein [Geomonas paludis]GFO66108.1 methyl-accepting chemotaxis protein [Geomonas paludis]